ANWTPAASPTSSSSAPKSPAPPTSWPTASPRRPKRGCRARRCTSAWTRSMVGTECICRHSRLRGNDEFEAMTITTPAIAHHAALDARMTRAAKGVRLLSLVSWPASEQEKFLAELARGNPALPAYAYPRHDFGEARREFEAIAAAADPDHPLGQYLAESARSWNL